MGGRKIPHYCEHGVPIDGGDFVDSEHCPDCEIDLPPIASVWKGKLVPLEKLQTEQASVALLRDALNLAITEYDAKCRLYAAMNGGAVRGTPAWVVCAREALAKTAPR